MKNDQLEFLLSQYLDGLLDAPQRAELEQRLAEDGEARTLLEQYRKLDGALRSLPLPAVRWEALCAQISQAVDDLPVGNLPVGNLPVGDLSVDGVPAGDAKDERDSGRSYAMPWVRSAALWQRVTRLAVAALIALTVGLGIHLVRHDNSNVAVPSEAIASNILGPQVELPVGTAVEDIAIGLPTNMAEGERDWSTPQAIVSEPSRLVIASGDEPVQDTLQLLPY